MEQRWLSLDGICTTLGMSKEQIKYLVSIGALVSLKGKSNMGSNARYLDPTPEYAEKLKFGEALYGRLHPVPIDIPTTALLTIREVALIMNWKLVYARHYLYEKKIPAIKVGRYHLYSVETVRDLLWRRQGRKLSKQRSPFLIQNLIDFFLKYQAEEAEEVPTDIQFAEDDLLQRKLVRLSKMKDPSALRDFLEKINLTKKIVSLLRNDNAQ